MSSSNIKSWADHCSSDEESDDGHHHPANNAAMNIGAPPHEDEVDEEEEYYEEPQLTVADLPPGPPYTAFLGNLPYDLRDANDLGYELEGLLQNRGVVVDGPGNVPVRIAGTRLMTDRETMKPKGFGYVEFDQPEELLAFLRLPNPQLCGRTIKVDVAESAPRRQSSRGGGGGRRDHRGDNRRGSQDARMGGGFMNRGGGMGENRRDSRGGMGGDRGDRGPLPPIDGTQFRGGIPGGSRGSGGGYGRGASSGSLGGSGTGPGMIRHDSGMSAGGQEGGGAPRQRPSLKLAPRTKPVEEAKSASTAQSSIFGGAKPRDESKYLERKASEVKEKAPEKKDDMKDVTSSMAAMDVREIKKNDAAKTETVSNAPGKETSEAKKDDVEPYADKDFSAADSSAPNKEESSEGNAKGNNERRDSRAGGGRGGGRGERGGRGGRRENSSRNREGNPDGRGKRGEGRGEGRKDSTRKPGRGEGRGEGSRRDSARRSGRGGEGSRRDSTRKSGRGENGKNGGRDDKAKDSAKAAPSAVPMPVQEKKKDPPKKVNSFAALMGDSDED